MNVDTKSTHLPYPSLSGRRQNGEVQRRFHSFTIRPVAARCHGLPLQRAWRPRWCPPDFFLPSPVVAVRCAAVLGGTTVVECAGQSGGPCSRILSRSGPRRRVSLTRPKVNSEKSIKRANIPDNLLGNATVFPDLDPARKPLCYLARAVPIWSCANRRRQPATDTNRKFSTVARLILTARMRVRH